MLTDAGAQPLDLGDERLSIESCKVFVHVWLPYGASRSAPGLNVGGRLCLVACSYA